MSKTTKVAESCKCHNSASTFIKDELCNSDNYNIEHDGVLDDSDQKFSLCGLS